MSGTYKHTNTHIQTDRQTHTRTSFGSEVKGRGTWFGAQDEKRWTCRVGDNDVSASAADDDDDDCR